MTGVIDPDRQVPAIVAARGRPGERAVLHRHTLLLFAGGPDSGLNTTMAAVGDLLSGLCAGGSNPGSSPVVTPRRWPSAGVSRSSGIPAPHPIAATGPAHPAST